MNLLFVCNGNICRSPMAEGLAEHLGDRMGLDISAQSAGILGIQEAPADRLAVKVCQELGVDLRGHRSQRMSNELVRWADRIFVMELVQATHIRQYFEHTGDKLLLLGPFGGLADIADPLGGWSWRFRRTRRELEACITAALKRL